MNIDRIRAFFDDDRFCKENGVVIDEVCDEYALISVNIEERHLNAGNAAQGGLIFTLADFAFAVFANRNGVSTVSQNANITFLRPALGKKLTAKAVPLHEGRRTVSANVSVTDENGKEIAFATISGSVLGENKRIKE